MFGRAAGLREAAFVSGGQKIGHSFAAGSHANDLALALKISLGYNAGIAGFNLLACD
jgi:hypothetical protein